MGAIIGVEDMIGSFGGSVNNSGQSKLLMF